MNENNVKYFLEAAKEVYEAELKTQIEAAAKKIAAEVTGRLAASLHINFAKMAGGFRDVPEYKITICLVDQ